MYNLMNNEENKLLLDALVIAHNNYKNDIPIEFTPEQMRLFAAAAASAKEKELAASRVCKKRLALKDAAKKAAQGERVSELASKRAIAKEKRQIAKAIEQLDFKAAKKAAQEERVSELASKRAIAKKERQIVRAAERAITKRKRQIVRAARAIAKEKREIAKASKINKLKKPVIADGVRYASRIDAARAYGIRSQSMEDRIKSRHFDAYYE